MSRDKKIKRIDDAILLMRDELERANRYNTMLRMVERCERSYIRDRYVEKVIIFVEKLAGDSFRDLSEILDKLPQEQWDYFELMGFDDLLEVEWLIAARKAFKIQFDTLKPKYDTVKDKIGPEYEKSKKKKPKRPKLTEEEKAILKERRRRRRAVKRQAAYKNTENRAQDQEGVRIDTPTSE